MTQKCFTFGSNLAGYHGAGAAKTALNYHGAIWGRGIGHEGDSYAIPTKDHEIVSLSLNQVEWHVDMFLKYASEHPEITFKVTRIGCGLAGFTDREIAPMFKAATTNCQFDSAWKRFFDNPNFTYWGTYP